MGIAVQGVLVLLAPYLASEARLMVKIGALTAVVGTGVVVFAALIITTGVLSLTQLKRFTRRPH